MLTVAERDVVFKALEPFRFVASFVDDLIAFLAHNPAHRVEALALLWLDMKRKKRHRAGACLLQAWA